MPSPSNTRQLLVCASFVALALGVATAAPPISAQADGIAPVLVSVAGDIACGTTVAAYNNGDGTATQCRQKYTGQLLAGSDAVWTLGDHIYPTSTSNQFQFAYDPTGWGQAKGITYPSPGDHDYGKIYGSGYFGYFGKPEYYSFDMGGWHVISLNTEIDHSTGSPQELWLKQDLDAASATTNCIAAYWGEPRFTSGKKAPGDVTSDPFWQDLYAVHADLVMSGDTHNYERFAKMAPDESATTDGIREFVVGTGGRNLVGFPSVQPTSEKRIKSFGVLKLTLQDGSYDWRFENESATTLDSGTEACN